MQLGVAEGSLAVRLAWLTAVRLLVLTLFLIVTSVVYLPGHGVGGFSNILSLVTVAAAYGVAATYALLLRLGRWLQPLAYLQLATDQLTWTLLVYVTGGVTSGATTLYGLTCLSGAILMGLPGALTAAVTGLGLLVALTSAMIEGFLWPPPDQLNGPYALSWDVAAYPLLVNLLGIAVVTALASYLAERLRATGGRLEVATERAERAERFAVLGQLAAGLAHEIRNPLGSIAGSIELLRGAPGLDDEDRRLCDLIEGETSRLNDLVTDMLHLSRPREPELSVVDVCSVAREVSTLASKSGRGVDVGVRYEGEESIQIRADGPQLRQLLWNLVRNAVQASSAGDEVVIRVDVTPAKDVVVAVIDHGQGIPPESRERLFDAFFTTRAHGTGVGLAVVQRICEAHGFGIEVNSEDGEGTAFRVQIPGPPWGPDESDLADEDEGDEREDAP